MDPLTLDFVSGTREMHTWISHASRLHLISQMSAPSRTLVLFWYTKDAGMKRGRQARRGVIATLSRDRRDFRRSPTTTA